MDVNNNLMLMCSSWLSKLSSIIAQDVKASPARLPVTLFLGIVAILALYRWRYLKNEAVPNFVDCSQAIQLKELLEKSSMKAGCGQCVDLTNPRSHSFIFDFIKDKTVLDSVWLLFPQHTEVRCRLMNLERCSTFSRQDLRRRPLKNPKKQCTDEELKSLVSTYIINLRPLLNVLSDSEVIDFIDSGFTVQIVNSGEKKHYSSRDDSSDSDGENDELQEVLNEALEEFLQEELACGSRISSSDSGDGPMLEILLNWAMNLTSEGDSGSEGKYESRGYIAMAAYLLWPCIMAKHLSETKVKGTMTVPVSESSSTALSATPGVALASAMRLGIDTMDPALRLWEQGYSTGSGAFWVKGGDFASKVVCVRRPGVVATTATTSSSNICANTSH